MFIIVPLCYLANLATVKYTYIHLNQWDWVRTDTQTDTQSET